MNFDEETIPCPTCWLPADLVSPPAWDSNPHSVCPSGHDNTLVPAVLAHLRTLQDKIIERPA
jgi:hypothetical protein